VWPGKRFSCLTPIVEQIIYYLTSGVLGVSYNLFKNRIGELRDPLYHGSTVKKKLRKP
jgi:hypothetical protein